MRLTNYTDYALRVLIFLALKKEDELSTIKEIAETYQISKNHLMKIIHDLGKLRLYCHDPWPKWRHQTCYRIQVKLILGKLSQKQKKTFISSNVSPMEKIIVSLLLLAN